MVTGQSFDVISGTFNIKATYNSGCGYLDTSVVQRWATGRGWEFFLFTTVSRPALGGASSLLSNGYEGLFP